MRIERLQRPYGAVGGGIVCQHRVDRCWRTAGPRALSSFRACNVVVLLWTLRQSQSGQWPIRQSCLERLKHLTQLAHRAREQSRELEAAERKRNYLRDEAVLRRMRCKSLTAGLGTPPVISSPNASIHSGEDLDYPWYLPSVAHDISTPQAPSMPCRSPGTLLTPTSC